MPFTPEQQAALNADLNRARIKTRRQSGRELSYVDGFYVIDRLNEVFGPGGWSYQVQPMQACQPYTDEKSQSRITFTALVTLKIGDCVITDVGAGHGIDRDLGQAIESAIKEAATDALKRCAKSLGRSMGLALYDKEQEYVTTAEERTAQRKAETPEETAARQAGHHPSWSSHQKTFMGSIKQLKFNSYDELCEFLEWRAREQGKTFYKPSEYTTERRNQLLVWLGSDEAAESLATFLERKGMAMVVEANPEVQRVTARLA